MPTCRYASGALILGSMLVGCDTAQANLGKAATASSRTDSASEQGGDVVVFRGACDASGAVPLDARHFAVADDEDSVLRVYDARVGGAALYRVDVSDALDLRSKKRKKRGKKQQKPRKAPETDIEAATRIGERAYFITSHARKKSGKRDPSRFRFFATELPRSGNTGTVMGRAYSSLVDDMLMDPALAAFDLDEASMLSPDAVGGLNIEGLTATPDGRLLIGFRSPVPKGRALVLPLNNPDGVLEGARPEFGAARQLDLEGHGVRALTWWRGHYWLIAGASSGRARSLLYRWDGQGAARHVKSVEFGDLNPEGFFTPESLGRIMVLSDDGAKPSSGKRCKDLGNTEQKSFRGVWVSPHD